MGMMFSKEVEQAPPPAVGFDQVKEMCPHQVVNWLEEIDYFGKFGDAIHVDGIKQRFVDHNLSGSALIKSGGNLDRLIPCLTYGPALELSEIIVKMNHKKGEVIPTDLLLITPC